jgi:3-oxoacyl-[acyl-carrier-protein] synthase II
MEKRRVVVTGLGMISPLGLSVNETWVAILDSKSGIRPLQRLELAGLGTTIAGQIQGFEPNKYFPLKEQKKIDLFAQYAFAAAQEAIEDAHLEITEENNTRIGVAVGSGIGGIASIETAAKTMFEKGVDRISPFFIPSCIINMASGYISMRYKLHGPNISVVTACTTGNHNIGYAARTIAYGDADVMIAGGAEMATSLLGMGGFAALRALSTRNGDPTRASRPWDKDRDGFVLSEGAGVLVLEEYEHAKKRGATIYAEVAGFGMSADAMHMTMNDQTGEKPALCMTNALKDAGMSPEDIGYINAHATSTPVGDPAEVKAIKISFGDHAYKLAVSSTKSMTGHLLGAAGSVEAIFSLLALRDQVVPPTINLENPDEGCDLNFVPNIAQQRKLKAVLSNSFGFGGTNASLILRSLE